MHDLTPYTFHTICKHDMHSLSHHKTTPTTYFNSQFHETYFKAHKSSTKSYLNIIQGIISNFKTHIITKHYRLDLNHLIVFL
jgi:hypothetical protein